MVQTISKNVSGLVIGHSPNIKYLSNRLFFFCAKFALLAALTPAAITDKRPFFLIPGESLLLPFWFEATDLTSTGMNGRGVTKGNGPSGVTIWKSVEGSVTVAGGGAGAGAATVDFREEGRAPFFEAFGGSLNEASGTGISCFGGGFSLVREPSFEQQSRNYEKMSR